MAFKDYLGYVWAFLVGVAGLGLWQYQLIAKRRYEVVEEALTVVGKAVKALHHIRQAQADVQMAIERDTQSPQPELWLTSHERIQSSEGVFEDLDATGRAMAMHFGDDAAVLFSRLSSVFYRLCEAQNGYWFRSAAEKVLPTKEQAQQRDAWKADLYAQATDDAVAQEIKDIDARIKKAFGAYLRPSLWRLFFPPKGWKKS